VDRREAIAEDLRALADDLKNLLDSATTDPKARRWKERRWSALEGAIGVLTTLVARRAAVKLWGILTGEEAPKRPPTEPVRGGVRLGETERQVETRPEPESQPESEAETISSSSSSVK
jgi:hypothetical protein